MPHKFNADRRDKIPKQKQRVTNWAECNEGLRRRGDLTIWISEDALALWAAPRRTTRGGQARYSDLAIELCLTLGLVFKQQLRQSQGLMRSIARSDPVVGQSLWSTLCRLHPAGSPAAERQVAHGRSRDYDPRQEALAVARDRHEWRGS